MKPAICKRCHYPTPARGICTCDSYVPTPEQIRAECAAIQATWSEIERNRRTCLKNGEAYYGAERTVEVTEE